MAETASLPSEPHSASDKLPRSLWRRRVLIVALVAAVGCTIDLLTKSYMFDWLGTPPEHHIHWLLDDYVGFETSVNTGALFGMGTGNTALLAVISIVATIGIIAWVVQGGAVTDWIVTIAVGMILGGVWGNLYDRLGLWGFRGVRDWILFRYGDFVWPNFNIADSLLVCGSALLVIHAFRRPEPVPPIAKDPSGN